MHKSSYSQESDESESFILSDKKQLAMKENSSEFGRFRKDRNRSLFGQISSKPGIIMEEDDEDEDDQEYDARDREWNLERREELDRRGMWETPTDSNGGKGIFNKNSPLDTLFDKSKVSQMDSEEGTQEPIIPNISKNKIKSKRSAIFTPATANITGEICTESENRSLHFTSNNLFGCPKNRLFSEIEETPEGGHPSKSNFDFSPLSYKGLLMSSSRGSLGSSQESEDGRRLDLINAPPRKIDIDTHESEFPQFSTNVNNRQGDSTGKYKRKISKIQPPVYYPMSKRQYDPNPEGQNADPNRNEGNPFQIPKYHQIRYMESKRKRQEGNEHGLKNNGEIAGASSMRGAINPNAGDRGHVEEEIPHNPSRIHRPEDKDQDHPLPKGNFHTPSLSHPSLLARSSPNLEVFVENKEFMNFIRKARKQRDQTIEDNRLRLESCRKQVAICKGLEEQAIKRSNNIKEWSECSKKISANNKLLLKGSEEFLNECLIKQNELFIMFQKIRK